MTGLPYLDWPIIAISLFNAILSLWLALTVLLNAEHRNWGVIQTGTGLLTSAAFFICHTVIVGWPIDPSGQGLDFWWHVGWVPIILAPFGWYGLMLWYSGFWESPRAEGEVNRLRRRQEIWLILVVLLLIVLIGVAIFYTPSFTEAIHFDFTVMPAILGVPVLLLLYPAFIVMCVALALDALIRPGPSHRVLGELARQRSRPWLVAVSAALLSVTLLVSGAIVWGINRIVEGRSILLNPEFIRSVAWFDLASASLIGIAIVLMGRAIVSYEVFTGKTLPRQGFIRNWRGVLLLAAGYSSLAGGSMVLQLRPIYGLLLGAALMTAFYALFNWRSFVERDQFMKNLRPFVSSQGLLRQLTTREAITQGRARAMFNTLCNDILGAEHARLIPLSTMAPLVGDILCYPASDAPGSRAFHPAEIFPSPDDGLMALPSEQFDPFRWGIPLWTERGLVGALLLANKQDGGLYTQEEIEVARATSEGILDAMAGEEMARRLMELQRRRLTQSAVMDRQARRVLHDEVLPDLHTALLDISTLPREEPTVRSAIETLTHAHRQIADLIHSVAGAPPVLQKSANLVEAIRAILDSEFKEEFDFATLEISGEPCSVDPLVEEVLFYAAREAIRNAAVHGRSASETRPLRLRVDIVFGEDLTITITDNGVGPHAGRAGEAPVSRSGGHGGLALHSTMLAVIGGTLTVEPAPGSGTRVTITTTAAKTTEQ